ncbi:uncharacterized protein LOC127811773 isoform X2 [Diospyros lotus]|uniref:uncharacterized protein LOC127811773 isoform X2 n=1 Tax=Diospyros lotus TaxID=55363 RepID=UPI0022512A88|nr:uncharacterized protein LOC127811773 isoform X2 [Diospyros lotus]
MSILWEKSETWRWIVRKTRDSKGFFLAFATVCGVVPGIIGYGVMQVTSSGNERLEAELRRNSRPDSLNFFCAKCGMHSIPRKALQLVLPQTQLQTAASTSCP